MKDVDIIIEQIKNKLETDLPSFLTANGIANFDTYNFGYATDPKKLTLSVRFSGGSDTLRDESFIFTVHLYLPNIPDSEAYKYLTAMNQYLAIFDPIYFGFQKREINIEVLENFQAADVQAFYDITMSDILDDCEER